MTSVIQTARCQLRPASATDLVVLVSALQSPQFPAALPLSQLKTEAALATWFERMLARAAQGTAHVWSIDVQCRMAADQQAGIKSGLPSGTRCGGQVSLIAIPNTAAWALAFWLHPAYWGAGLAAEAAAAVIDHAFNTDNISEIRAAAALWNHSSIKTLQKLNMQPTGINPDGYRIADLPQAVQEFAFTARNRVLQ
jgi:RimJ/RimL family protein N-acetyltransferase